MDVEVTAFKSEEVATQAVINGQADVGQGTPYAAHSESQRADPLFLPVERAAVFPGGNKESYKSWKDLDGQEIAVQGRGSGTEAIMLLAAKQHGIKYKNVSYVPGSQVRALALLKGNIKATILDAPNKNRVMKEAPDKFIILPLGNLKASDEALFATREFLDKNQAAIADFRGRADQGQSADQCESQVGPRRAQETRALKGPAGEAGRGDSSFLRGGRTKRRLSQTTAASRARPRMIWNSTLSPAR